VSSVIDGDERLETLKGLDRPASAGDRCAHGDRSATQAPPSGDAAAETTHLTTDPDTTQRRWPSTSRTASLTDSAPSRNGGTRFLGRDLTRKLSWVAVPGLSPGW